MLGESSRVPREVAGMGPISSSVNVASNPPVSERTSVLRDLITPPTPNTGAPNEMGDDVAVPRHVVVPGMPPRYPEPRPAQGCLVEVDRNKVVTPGIWSYLKGVPAYRVGDYEALRAEGLNHGETLKVFKNASTPK